MTKVTSVLAAGALALSLNSLALAAEKAQDQSSNPSNPKTRNQTGAPNSEGPGATPTDESKRYEEYLGAVEKCQDVQEMTKQQKCLEQARRKYNRM